MVVVSSNTRSTHEEHDEKDFVSSFSVCHRFPFHGWVFLVVYSFGPSEVFADSRSSATAPRCSATRERIVGIVSFLRAREFADGFD